MLNGQKAVGVLTLAAIVLLVGKYQYVMIVADPDTELQSAIAGIGGVLTIGVGTATTEEEAEAGHLAEIVIGESVADPHAETETEIANHLVKTGRGIRTGMAIEIEMISEKEKGAEVAAEAGEVEMTETKVAVVVKRMITKAMVIRMPQPLLTSNILYKYQKYIVCFYPLTSLVTVSSSFQSP